MSERVKWEKNVDRLQGNLDKIIIFGGKILYCIYNTSLINFFIYIIGLDWIGLGIMGRV